MHAYWYSLRGSQVASLKRLLLCAQFSSKCYLQSLAIRGDLRDLFVDPVDEVCIASRQEAILRDTENTDKWIGDSGNCFVLYIF